MEKIELCYFNWDNEPEIKIIKVRTEKDYNNLMDHISRIALYIADIKGIKLETLQRVIKDFYKWKSVHSISDFKHSQHTYRILKANAYDLMMEMQYANNLCA